MGRPASSIKNPMAPVGAPIDALPVQGRQPGRTVAIDRFVGADVTDALGGLS